MTYHVGQIVTVELLERQKKGRMYRRKVRAPGTITKALSADHFNRNLLVVVDGLYETADGGLIWRDGERHFVWVHAWELDRWRGTGT